MRTKYQMEKYRETEDILIDNIGFKDVVVDLAQKLLPFIKADMAVNDIEKALEKFAPLGFMKMAEIAIQGESERNRLQASIALVDRAGYKPVERSITLEGDLNKLQPNQLDSFLKNAWNRLPDQDKSKLINLISQPDGTYTVPKENEVPNVENKDIDPMEVE